MNKNTEQPTIEIFQPLLGSEFDILVDGELLVTARLAEVFALTPATKRSDLGIRQDPFSLIFRIDKDHPQLEQGIYGVAHENTGAREMFLVPVGFGEYQAIFN